MSAFCPRVKNITLGLDLGAGFDPHDPASVHQDAPAYTSQLEANAKLRVGVLREISRWCGPAVRAAFDAAIKVLASEGGEIVDLDVPELSYAAMTSMLTSSRSAGINRRWFRERYHDFVPHVARQRPWHGDHRIGISNRPARASSHSRSARSTYESRHHRCADVSTSRATVVREA